MLRREFSKPVGGLLRRNCWICSCGAERRRAIAAASHVLWRLAAECAEQARQTSEAAGARRGQDPKKQGSAEDNVVGLEQLKEADLWIGSANKRNFPSPDQLTHFQDYLAAGKPFAEYRAASHIFQNWLEVDQKVWGAKYGGHHLLNKDPELIVELAPKAAEHPILKDLKPPAPRSGSYFYRELADDMQVLLFSGLQGDMQPHTWPRIIKGSGSRVFYTRYDANQIAETEVCREILFARHPLGARGKLGQVPKGLTKIQMHVR